jgi:methionyl aminopeptidase
MFRPGTNVKDIGAVIHREIAKFPGLKPVNNLGGHQLEPNLLHAGVFIPNTPTAGDTYLLKAGDQFAVEPFATNGFGAIKNGPLVTIYRYLGGKKAKNLSLNDRAVVGDFRQRFGSVPFSPRWIDFLPPDEVNPTVTRFHKMGILHGYNIFVERGNGLVSQAEHTVLVTESDPIITTLPGGEASGRS